MRVPTIQQLRAAIDSNSTGGPLTDDQAMAAALTLMSSVLDEEHDRRVLQEFNAISYRTPKGSGFPLADVEGIINWREAGVARFNSALTQDVAVWDRNLGIATGALSAAAGVLLGPQATIGGVFSALAPLASLLQEMSR